MKILLFIAIIILIVCVLAGYYYQKNENKMCGGFTGEVGQNACQMGFSCIYKSKNPDVSGKCHFLGKY